jgi:hypothetical protein
MLADFVGYPNVRMKAEREAKFYRSKAKQAMADD